MKTDSFNLAGFSSISLEDLNKVKLRDRQDTKFVFNQNIQPLLLDKLNPYTPYISYEFFHILKDESSSYNKFRLGLGIEYEINEDKSLEIYCLYKGEFVKSEIEATNIIGLQYGYSF